MPSNMPVLCMICGITSKGDTAYLEHMTNKHGTTSPDKALQQKKAIENNIPKEIPLDKDAPPSDEFMQLAQMMDQPQPPIIATSANQPMSPPVKTNVKETTRLPQEEKKPLKLTYRWEGQCPQCGNTVKTIFVKETAVAWCLSCDEEIKSMEVYPIGKIKSLTPLFKFNTDIEKETLKILDPIEEKVLQRRKEMKSHAK